MDARVSFITLAVADVAASRRFYCDGLGWAAELDVPGEVLMIKVGDRLVLSLWDEAQFEAEVGPIRRGDGVAPITLAHNCINAAAVDAVLAEARAAGAAVTVATSRDWGGYSGYFSDPDGFRWEVAWNPFGVGQLVVPEVEPPTDRSEVGSAQAIAEVPGGARRPRHAGGVQTPDLIAGIGRTGQGTIDDLHDAVGRWCDVPLVHHANCNLGFA